MKISTGRSVLVALLVCLIAACGGDGGNNELLGSSGNSNCPAGVSACSGDTEIGRIGAVKLTAAGVQVIAASTNDLIATPRMRGMDAGIAYGLMPFDQGLASLRVARESGGAVTALNLLLSDLGLSWDGAQERPPIFETFGLARGRMQPTPTGLAALVPLPPASDMTFWNNNPATGSGTPANYANNIYFARALAASHCAATDTACIDAAKNGLHLQRGDWRSGGTRPDQVAGGRLHEDGATMAPDNIPFAGFKGYHNIWNWNYRYAQLAGWITQDTVNIVEWGGDDEHNKARRGIVAYGEPTPPEALPASGTARYIGRMQGWYSPDGLKEPYSIVADLEILVNFGTRTACVRLSGLRIDQDPSQSRAQDPQLIANSSNTVTITGTANALGGAVTHGEASGHLGARFFGPVRDGAPAEIGGVFSVSGARTAPIGGAIHGLGGFIARRATATP